MVKLAKFALPVVVLGLVAMLVISPFDKRDDVSFILDKKGVDKATERMRIEAARYAGGQLRPVYFYADELAGHVERQYHPGQ